jgi:hypothetical protein
MDASEIAKVGVELLSLLGAVVTLAMRIGGLKADAVAQFSSLEKKVKELQDESRAERVETRAALGDLKNGQTALALAQNGDHILLGRLDGAVAALDTRANSALNAQRADIDKTRTEVEAIRRDFDLVRRDVEYLKGRAERG